MTVSSVMLIGGPDSGKTNYLGRLWVALQSGQGKLKVSTPPDDIKYVEDALAHLLQGSFAPHSSRTIDEGRHDFTIQVAQTDASEIAPTNIVVPDVSGELWKTAVEMSELDSEWMKQLKQSAGAILFVRILSDQNVVPLDWVNAEELLKLGLGETDELKISTQVSLIELLRFLEHTLNSESDVELPRVAIVVTAWDSLDKERSILGPNAYLQSELPLFAGRLKDTKKLDVEIFGVSVVGGDLGVDKEFRDKFLDGELNTAGYVVVESEGEIKKHNDHTLPLAWIVGN